MRPLLGHRIPQDLARVAKAYERRVFACRDNASVVLALEAEVTWLEKELVSAGTKRVALTAHVKEATVAAEEEAAHLSRGLRKWETIDAAAGRTKENMVAKEMVKQREETETMNAKVVALTRKHEVEAEQLTVKRDEKVCVRGTSSNLCWVTHV